MQERYISFVESKMGNEDPSHLCAFGMSDPYSAAASTSICVFGMCAHRFTHASLTYMRSFISFVLSLPKCMYGVCSTSTCFGSSASVNTFFGKLIKEESEREMTLES